MKNKAIKIVGTIVIVGGMVFFTSGVGAQEITSEVAANGAAFTRLADTDGENGRIMGLRHMDSEVAAAVRTALENKDYEAWKEAVAQQDENLPEGSQSLLEKIDSEEAFLEFATNMEERAAEKVAKEEARQAIQDAVANNDYETWQALVAAREAGMENLTFSMLEKIDSAEDFAKLVRIHELQTEIQSIRDELGLSDMGQKGSKRMGHK